MKVRVISTLLVFLMAISCVYPDASAYYSSEVSEPISDSYCNEEIPTDRIIRVLSSIERSKETWGLADIDFESIYIGDPVYTYVYSDDSFTQNSKIYPISDDEKIILLAVDHNGGITITTELVETLNSVIDSDDSFTIMYDSYGCYICTNDSRIQVTEYEVDAESETPSSLPEDNEDFSENVTYTRLTDKYFLPYVTPCIPHASGSYTYSCNVSIVSQQPDNKICWAASVACIVNYLKGTRLTAQSVARDYYGAIYNDGLNMKYIPDVLSSYKVTYDPQIYYPTDYQIYNNLRLGYPLYSRWVAYEDAPNHACVLFAIDNYSGTVSIMDPWDGSYHIAEYNGHDYWYHSVGLEGDYYLGAALLYKA